MGEIMSKQQKITNDITIPTVKDFGYRVSIKIPLGSYEISTIKLRRYKDPLLQLKEISKYFNLFSISKTLKIPYKKLDYYLQPDKYAKELRLKKYIRKPSSEFLNRLKKLKIKNMTFSSLKNKFQYLIQNFGSVKTGQMLKTPDRTIRSYYDYFDVKVRRKFKIELTEFEQNRISKLYDKIVKLKHMIKSYGIYYKNRTELKMKAYEDIKGYCVERGFFEVLSQFSKMKGVQYFLEMRDITDTEFFFPGHMQNYSKDIMKTFNKGVNELIKLLSDTKNYSEEITLIFVGVLLYR